MRRLKLLLTGVSLGVVGYAIYVRYQRESEYERAERLLVELSEQLDTLEALFERS